MVLTAEIDDPGAGEEPQQGGEGGGHASIWQHHVAHCNERTNISTSCEHTQLPEDDADLAPYLQPPAKKITEFRFDLEGIAEGGTKKFHSWHHKGLYRRPSLSEQRRRNNFAGLTDILRL